MSYEDLIKNKMPIAPQSAPKEEQRVDELSIPSKGKKSEYEELASRLSPQDQGMLEMVKDYDSVKKKTRSGNTEPSEQRSQIDMQANQSLSTKNKEALSALKRKTDSQLTLPKKIS